MVQHETCSQCLYKRRQMTEREGFCYLNDKRSLLGCKNCSNVHEALYCLNKWKKTADERYKKLE